jgi:aryl-alcohol dehydrogenase-like predicted oxidoreductase
MLQPERPDMGYAVLDGVHEAGIRTYDSSHIYGGGGADRLLGAWVRDRGVRSEVVVMDKCCHPMDGKRRVSPAHIAEDLRTCLDNLRFDALDILTFHRDDPDVPVGELVEAMNQHIRAGLILAYGCSNWKLERFRAAVEYARSNGLHAPAVSSPHYSLAVSYDAPWEGCLSITGEGGRAERAYHQASRTCLFCWSSLSGGFFSGRYTRDNLATLTDGQAELAGRCYAREDNFQRLDRARILASERGATTSQIALAYVLSAPLDAFPLIACWRPEEAHENAAACDLALSESERAWLDLRSDSRA